MNNCAAVVKTKKKKEIGSCDSTTAHVNGYFYWLSRVVYIFSFAKINPYKYK